ncbi:winged helix-turn-helix domain-containing protein [Archaeoglobus neptunius]|uniref:winged helix-turn-helix domain-containing protein n=1 Tax=Archaeoglobus neptunius TaxID=2798580 RepID=UPI001E59B242|nr:winged helix-turn-helix domain-containing protein [Archaeoglobus neptunius]
MDKSELLKRKQEWLEKIKKEGKLRDPTEDHKIGLIALQNKIRREILKFIGIGSKRTFGEIKEMFRLSDTQAKMHLDLLEQALFVESFDENGKKCYALTPRGKAYLENVEWR